MTYDYDALGEMAAVREYGPQAGSGVLAGYGYDDLGRRTYLERGNGTVTRLRGISLMKRAYSVFFILILSSLMLSKATSANIELLPPIQCPKRIPVGDYYNIVVPDKITAYKLALIILYKTYGIDQINGQRPLLVFDKGIKYVISGSFHGGGFGGVAEISICKSNASVLSLTHGK